MSVRREEEPVVVRELLEPRLSLDQKRERVVHSLLTTKPEITRISRSSVLDEVSGDFLFLSREEAQQAEKIVSFRAVDPDPHSFSLLDPDLGGKN